MSSETDDRSLNGKSAARRGAYPIPLSAMTTAGFVGRAERGPVNEPVCVESFPEYCRYFGGHLAGGAVSHAVYDYFLHGGRRAVIVRVTNHARRAEIEVPTAGEPLRLEARYPGRHDALRVSVDYEQVETDPLKFNLVVQRVSASDSRLIEDQELYPLLSVDPADERFVGKILRDSQLVMLAGPVPVERPLATPPERPGEPMRYINVTRAGDDGVELTDYDLIGSDRHGTGLFAFSRGPHIDLLCIPLPPDQELGTTAFVAASRYCAEARALLILDPPTSWQSVDSVVLGAQRMDVGNSNVMLYFPRIRPRGAHVRGSDGMPACGAIAGMLAERDRRGIFTRERETDYLLRAALAPVLKLSVADGQRLARYGINSFVLGAHGANRLFGRVVFGYGKGLSSGLDRRRLGLFILDSIEAAVSSASADGDLGAALMRVEWQLRRFLDDLYLRGALEGRTPGQAYYLQARGIDLAGPLGLRFGIALSEPSRFAEYRVDLEGDRAGRIYQLPGFEAEQFLN
jgi:hypothetical protein